MGRLLPYLRIVGVVGLVAAWLAFAAAPCGAQQNNNNNKTKPKSKSNTARVLPSVNSGFVGGNTPFGPTNPFGVNPIPQTTPIVFSPVVRPIVSNPVSPVVSSPVGPVVSNPPLLPVSPVFNPWQVNPYNPYQVQQLYRWQFNQLNLQNQLNQQLYPWLYNQYNPLNPWMSPVNSLYNPMVPVAVVPLNPWAVNPFAINQVNPLAWGQWNPMLANPFALNQLNALRWAQFNAALNPFAANGFFQGGDGAFGGGFNAGGFRGF
jgi:hypothetical protein